MAYEPLVRTSNQIRVLRFLDSTDSYSRHGLIRCSVENVSLDDLQQTQSIHTHLHHQQQGTRWDAFTKNVDLRDAALEQTTIHENVSLGLVENEKNPGVSRYNWGDFEALSYTWGDKETESRMILLNGVCRNVSSNLEEGLRALRDLPETRLGMRYWVDSLCIDQENLIERHQQVKCMKDIYSKARAVIIWLGREERDEREDVIAVRVMRHLCRNPNMEYPLLLPPNLLLDGWDAICAFMKKRYWNRAWIIQELAMNHNSTLILCGRFKLTRRMIRLGALYCQEWSDHQPDQTEHRLESDAWSTARRVHRLVGLTVDPHSSGSLNMPVYLVHQADATDKRDKIYGILGLLDEPVSSKIVPNYEHSVQQVYTDFMISVTDTTKSLDQIIFAGISVNKSWPSWVPDWRVPFERHHIRYARSYQVSGDSPATTRTWRNGEKHLLTCRGYKVDVVDGVAAQPPLYSGTTQSTNTSNRYGEDISQALWRTLLMDHPGAYGEALLFRMPFQRDWTQSRVLVASYQYLNGPSC